MDGVERRRPKAPPFRAGGTGARALLSAFEGLPDLLEEFGVPSVAVLRQYGLTRADLEQPDGTGSFEDMGRLLAQCVEKTKCGHFGLLLSRSASLYSLGLIGRLARHAPTVGAALDGLTDYFALHDTGGALDLLVKGEAVQFVYTAYAPVPAPEQLYDFSVGFMNNILQELCGADWRPTQVMLPRRPPRQLEPYLAVFKAPLQFETTEAGVSFASHWLSGAVPGADPLLYRLLLREVRAGMNQANPLICSDVRRAIVRSLHDGHCSRREVARILGLHERTLCRCLQAAGTTFHGLLDQVRSEMAQQLLGDTHVPMSRIARELGFRNSTILARAFRRWNGMSPREYRNGLRQPH